MRAVPETLDFAGPAGLWQQRHPLARFTKAVSDTFVTELALETPEDAFYINAERLTRWPDLAASGYWQIGDGYGTYIKGGPREGAFNTATSELEAIGIFGSFGGVQHFWSQRFSSNLVYGYVNSNNPGLVGGDTFDNTNYVAADLIWAPYKTTTIGAEYLWGRREDKDGASGTGNRFLFSSRFDF